MMEKTGLMRPAMTAPGVRFGGKADDRKAEQLLQRGRQLMLNFDEEEVQTPQEILQFANQLKPGDPNILNALGVATAREYEVDTNRYRYDTRKQIEFPATMVRNGLKSFVEADGYFKYAHEAVKYNGHDPRLYLNRANNLLELSRLAAVGAEIQYKRAMVPYAPKNRHGVNKALEPYKSQVDALKAKLDVARTAEAEYQKLRLLPNGSRFNYIT